MPSSDRQSGLFRGRLGAPYRAGGRVWLTFMSMSETLYQSALTDEPRLNIHIVADISRNAHDADMPAAARFRGVPGPPPSDLDLDLVSGTQTRFTLGEHRAAIEQATGLTDPGTGPRPSPRATRRLRARPHPAGP